jgi:MinD-like ATPase involved in chromosome partitioning or flagellar assembly
MSPRPRSSPQTGLDTPLWPPTAGQGPGDRLLRPEDYLPEEVEPPAMGWRGTAWRMGIRRLRPAVRELRHRGWVRLARRSLASPKVIAVFSPKGGVGKSTTALQLGQMLAAARGDLVVALDANPDSGNLVKRVHPPYSVGSAGELYRDCGKIVRYADLVPYITQTDSGLCVVRSDPAAAGRLGPQEYKDVLAVLSQFYTVIVVDLGTGMREPAFLSIMECADAVVGVTLPSFDSAEVLLEGLVWLAARFPDKIAAGTAVINGLESGSRGLDIDRLATELDRRVGRVLRVPRDRHLAAGGVPQWPLLGRRTQDAYLELAASVVDALPEDPQLE